MKLTDLKKGDCAIIRGVSDDEDLMRMKALGVCQDRRLELVQRGDPLIFKIFGSRIGLSARLAVHVEVEPCETLDRCWMKKQQEAALDQSAP